jgi:hypothetical protein
MCRKLDFHHWELPEHNTKLQFRPSYALLETRLDCDFSLLDHGLGSFLLAATAGRSFETLE